MLPRQQLPHVDPETPSHEVAALLNRELVSISPRMRPLCDKGCVRETGRLDGRTVWEATP